MGRLGVPQGSAVPPLLFLWLGLREGLRSAPRLLFMPGCKEARLLRGCVAPSEEFLRLRRPQTPANGAPLFFSSRLLFSFSFCSLLRAMTPLQAF